MVKVTFNNKKPAQQKTAPVSPEKESAGGVKVTFSAERTRRTKPFSTAANASTQQKYTTVPQTKRGKAASPMFRVQQNDIVPQAQSALAQKMAQGALQKEYAKNYQSMDTFNQHAQDVKAPTVAQRAGNTLKGAAKTYGAGIVNISGMAAQGQGGTAMSPVYREQVEILDQQIAALEATLSDPTMTAQDIADTKEAIANAKAQRDLYQTAVRSGEKTAESVYGVADLVTDSGAEDINKAKSGLGKVGRLAVDVGVAGAQMGADAALGALTGGGALAPMFVRSAGGSAQQARREGATHEQQVNYGFASGVLSVATEKISNVAAPFKKMFGGGFLDNAIGGALAQMNGSAAGKIALSFLAEGGEEVIEDLLQPALQTIYNGKTLGGSYSQLEASEIINDFLVGGILGGLGGGVEAVGSRGGRFYDSHTEIQDITLPTQRRSDADAVNGIADRLFARYDSMIGESGRKAIRGTYQENTDTAQHVKEFIPAYNAGVEGKANPNPTNETAYAGYIAGQNDAKTEARRKTFAQENDGSSGLVYDEYVSREMNSTVADEINTVAKALGVRVRMDDQVLGGKANGVIEGSEIHIAKDANDPVMRVVGHEWTHRVQKLAPEQYTAFRNAIMEDPDVAEAANILYEQYNRMGVEISADEALDEAAANYAGEMIANTDVLNEFIRRHSEDRTLLEKLRDAIREIVGKLTGKAKQQAQTAEGLLQQAFEAAAKNSKNAATEGGKARFEIKTLDDGRPYVKADRQVLEGDDPKKWGVQLQNYINSEIRKGNDIVLPTADGGLVRLTERSAYKLSDNKSTDLKTHRKTQLSDEAYRLKETAASHIDEIILTGEFSHNMEDVGGVHKNDIGEDGFNSYVAYFEDSDGQYYRVSFVSALNGNEETAYSIGNIQKRRKPTTGNGSSARESSALNGGRLSGNSVLQNEGNVKRYSLKEQRAEDEAYLSLAEDPKRNWGKLQKMVNAAAERAGYDSPDLYHGTRAFGFTEFDLAKMDDGTSIFLTTNPTVAGTYTSADAENTNLETLYRNPKSPADRGNPLKRVDAKSAPLGEVIAAWNREADALGAHKYRAASHEEVLARAEREIGEEAPRMAAAAKRYAEETDGLSLPVRQYLKRLSDLGNYSGKRLYEEIFILKETESGFEQGTRPDREMNAFVERTGGIPAETAALARAALSDGAFVEYVPNGKNVRSGHPARATETKFREFYQRQAERENGIYKVRARLQNPLVIDAQGAAWSDVGVYAKELALEKNANLKQLAAELGLTVEDSGSFLSKKRSLRGPTRSWSQYAKSREYDGVIFKNLYDPGTDVENDANGVSDVYIVFDPAQVKSTEAVTYDDNGRAIPLSERFDAGKRDIRRSLKGTENAQEIAALKRENEMLRQRVGYWKGQTRRSDGVRTDSKSVQQAAKKLVKDYGAEIDSSEIAGDLANLYDYIARGGDETGELTYTEARRRADAIAEKIAENSMAKDEELYQEYSELRKFLRDTRLVLSAEDAASITDYSALRKSLFGKANLGKGARTNVDQVYSELAESYPEFFSETRENNVADQVARIADVANQLYNVSEYNPFEGYMGQAVGSISNDIMERFFDLPQAKKTFADVKAEQLSEARRAGRQAAADAKLAGQMAQGRADAARLRNTQQALEKERSRRVEQLSELRERYREKDATRRESQKSRELRAKITRHASALSQKLLRPSDTKHIPEEMRSSVAAVLNSINQESRYTVDENGKRVYDGSGTPTKRSEAFRTLRDQYQKVMNEGGDMVIDPSLFGSEADGVQGSLEQVIRMGDKRLSELSATELRTMWQVVKAVEHSVSTAGKLLSKSKYETTQQFADAFKSDVRTRRQKLGGNMTISLETPYTFFAHYGQAGKDIYRMLRNAQDQQEVMARDIAEKAQKVIGERAKAANAREWWNSARGSNVWKMNTEAHDFSTAGGDKLTLTTAQTMELYLLSKRKQALGHLLGGGVYQPEIRSAETGRTKVQRGTQQVFLTEDDIERITDTLTGEQKRIADGLQELTTGALAKYGNEASMRAYGYRKFTENDYWPIKSAREGLHSTQEKDGGNVRSIKNIGMAQQVQTGANNAVELRSVFDTFADHASDMIDYAAWLNPMEDANRLFNFQYRNDAGNKTGVSVKGLLEQKGGKGAQQYWQKLMGDIQNGISGKDFEPITGTFAKYVGKFKGAAVGANIRVVVQQPAAFFRASAVLNPADMAKGLTGGVTKGNGWKKAVEYSPIAMRKDVGSFDIASPYTLKERFYGKEGAANKLNDLAGAAAGKADAVTWGALWNACEWQVKREKPDVRAGSNEFYSAVNEVFSDMIDQTQVVDGILQRSNIMRGKSALSQQATAFMGEPIMSLNVLMRSYDAFRYEENPAKRSKALKNVGRAATALLVTNVVNALAQSVVDGLRDDDRDKDYWEKFLSAFTGVEGDENNALERVSNILLNGNVGDNINPIGQIPFVKDILSLAQGYDVSRPDMEIFSDLVNAAKTFIDSAGGNGKKTRKEATLGLIAASSKLFGLPVYNIKRDLTATLRTAAQASGSLAYQYEVEKFSYNLENGSNKSRFISILYDALEQGDYTTYEHIRRDLMEQMGLDGESIQSSLKTRYKKKTESEADYFLPQKSLDLLGIRGKYAYDSGEDEKKFSAADLNAGAYSRYEAQRTDTYRKAEEKATGSGAFQMLSNEGKDKALSYADTYAEETALAAIAGGQYEIATKWVREAQEAQQKYRIDPGVFAACRAAASECKTLKDRDGKPIDKSRGMQIMEMLFRSGLNEQQRKAMYEYLGVPENMRHWNRARVDEQLKIARRKAA